VNDYSYLQNGVYYKLNHFGLSFVKVYNGCLYNVDYGHRINSVKLDDSWKILTKLEFLIYSGRCYDQL